MQRLAREWRLKKSYGRTCEAMDKAFKVSVAELVE
jgi:hypothetical protein